MTQQPITLEALTERVMAIQSDVNEMKVMLKDVTSESAVDRAQLNVRMARVEEQNRIGRWVLGTIGGAAITVLVLAVIQVIQRAG